MLVVVCLFVILVVVAVVGHCVALPPMASEGPDLGPDQLPYPGADDEDDDGDDDSTSNRIRIRNIVFVL